MPEIEIETFSVSRTFKLIPMWIISLCNWNFCYESVVKVALILQVNECRPSLSTRCGGHDASFYCVKHYKCKLYKFKILAVKVSFSDLKLQSFAIHYWLIIFFLNILITGDKGWVFGGFIWLEDCSGKRFGTSTKYWFCNWAKWHPQEW